MNEDFDWCYQKDLLLKQSAPKQFVIGHGNESYRTNDHFLNSTEDIMTITALFSFSTGAVITACAFSDDSLNPERMNVREAWVPEVSHAYNSVERSETGYGGQKWGAKGVEASAAREGNKF